MVEALAAGRSAAQIDAAFSEYLEIADYLDAGLAVQTQMNLDVLERRMGRGLPPMQRAILERRQHQAARWTFLGSGMAHPRFRGTVAGLSSRLIQRLDAFAPRFV